MIDIPKNITSTTSGAQSRSYHGSQNTSSFFQEPYKCTVSQKIELGWENSFTIRQFFSVLKGFYHLRSSIIIESRMKNQETIFFFLYRNGYWFILKIKGEVAA
jgi:DNA-binding transcriptional regulator WhiA